MIKIRSSGIFRSGKQITGLEYSNKKKVNLKFDNKHNTDHRF